MSEDLGRSAGSAERRNAAGTPEPVTEEDGDEEREATAEAEAAAAAADAAVRAPQEQQPLNPALRLFRSRHIRD